MEYAPPLFHADAAARESAYIAAPGVVGSIPGGKPDIGPGTDAGGSSDDRRAKGSTCDPHERAVERGIEWVFDPGSSEGGEALFMPPEFMQPMPAAPSPPRRLRRGKMGAPNGVRTHGLPS